MFPLKVVPSYTACDGSPVSSGVGDRRQEARRVPLAPGGETQRTRYGRIYFFKTTPYYDALEIGYILYDEASRGKGLMMEKTMTS